MQKLCYLAAVSYAETYKGKDAYGCVERVVVGLGYPALLFKKSVEVGYKGGEQLQEGCVEVCVQLVRLLVAELGRACKLYKLGILLVFNPLDNLLANILELVDVYGA